jgi:hypothetical protein
MIELTYGGCFPVKELIDYMTASGMDHIIQGQKTCSRANHPKPHSLDFWFRQYAKSPDTKQADNEVMLKLQRTGKFDIQAKLKCPDSGNYCKGLILVKRRT